MKKRFTLAIMLMLCMNFMYSGNPEISMRINKQQQQSHTYSPQKTGGAWLAIGGGAAVVGSVYKVFLMNAPVPDMNNYSTSEAYNSAMNRYNRQQRAANTVLYSSVAVAGISFIFAGIELFQAPVMDNNKVTLQLKSSGTTAGLCLKFK